LHGINCRRFYELSNDTKSGSSKNISMEVNALWVFLHLYNFLKIVGDTILEVVCGTFDFASEDNNNS
jgi:hypothetical protein